MIPLFMTFVTSVMYLLCLRNFSINITSNFEIQLGGLAVFINTLLSVLVLALFLSTFPKRKKPNYILMGLVFLFYAVMIGMDILYYVKNLSYLDVKGEDGIEVVSTFYSTLSATIAHIALIAVDALLLATLPLYAKLIKKINTKKEIETSQLSEAIDTEE